MPTAINDGSRIHRLQQKGARVQSEVSGLTAELEGGVADLERIVRERMADRPYALLTAATGLGYVLGGGIPVALGRILIGTGARLAVVVLAQRLGAGVTAAITANDNANQTHKKEE